MMTTDVQENIDAWLQGPYDEASKNEIRRLQKENPELLVDAFYQKLSFGTGGLRGIMGVGTNRINSYTIAFASQGLAKYLLKQSSAPSVVIGYDTRHHSHEFAEEAARVFAGNGIKVYLFTELTPVALVSFSICHLQATAGVMITASHNPPEYNGYKVWWSDGVQVLPPHDKGIIEEVNQISDPRIVKKAELTDPRIQKVGEDLIVSYLKVIKKEALVMQPSSLSIVYSPLHGAGVKIIPRALSDWGFKDVAIVEEQNRPDGAFPTVKSPNPEEPDTLRMGIEKLKKSKGDIFIATDPDVDRVAVVAMHKHEPVLLNGNETACLLLEYICRNMSTLPPKPICVKTIVTTNLFKAICKHYNIACLDVLTGFKYIGQKLAQWEEEKAVNLTATHHYIFGGEESYGYLKGTHARDKDGVISAALICQTASYCKERGKTLVDFLHELYHNYGVYREKLASYTFPGASGHEKMKALMRTIREKPLKAIGGVDVEWMEDYLTHKKVDVKTAEVETLTLPKSDVLRFRLADHTLLVIRPSGTEPKIKVYCSCYDKHCLTTEKGIEESIKACDDRCADYLKKLKDIL